MEPRFTFRLNAPLLALKAAGENSRSVLVTLQPGCVLELLEELKVTGLADVLIEGERYTVFYPDLKKRGVTPPDADAANKPELEASH